MKKRGRKSIPVTCWTNDGRFIQRYESMGAAAQAIGVKLTNISQALRRNGYCNGYIWKREAA